MEACMKRRDLSSDDSDFDDDAENVHHAIISPYKRLKINTTQRTPEDIIAKKITMKKDGKTVKVLQNQGQLKLSVYMNFGHLTIHVVQARNLSSKWQNICDSYVKISLVPDEIKRTRCKTQFIMDSNNPTYDEKFSFELLEEDHNKRLLISLWHRDQSSSLSEFLGCMSFGVKHLLNPKKETHGWFYLLTEDIGRKKHLQVSKHKPTNQLKVRPHSNIPSINKDICWMDPTTITVPRGKNGYGFSVTDSCPVKVGRVDKSSPAEDAGLCKGDCIVRINQQNVSRSTSDSVVKLLKQSMSILVLDVQRPHQVSIETFDKSPWKPKATFHEHENCDNRDYGIDVCDSDDDNDDRSHENELSRGDVLSTEDYDVRITTPLPLLCNGPESSPSNARRKQEAIHRLLSIELDFIDFMHCGIERYSRPLRHCIITQRQHLQLFQNVEKLVTISEYHIKQMQDNVSSCSDTDTSSKSSNDTNHFVNSIGLIYQSKVQLLYQAYDTYARGMKDASSVLSDLKRNEDFLKFVSDVRVNPRQPPLTSFIYRPVQHIRDLYQTLRDIFECTTKDSFDYHKLKQVVEGLQECVMNITNYSCSRTTSWDSLSSTTSSSSGASSQSSQSSGRSGTRTKVPSPSLVSVRSCDSEVQRIQDSLLFPPHIQGFNLCNEERHVIYTGEMFVWDGQVWLKNHVLLLSDLILRTERDHQGNLRVMDHPICLQDVRGVDHQREHTTELVLRLDKRLTSRSKMVFRAPTTELKYTWKSLLEQRIYACKGNIEYFSSGSVNSSVATIII